MTYQYLEELLMFNHDNVEHKYGFYHKKIFIKYLYN